MTPHAASHLRFLCLLTKFSFKNEMKKKNTPDDPKMKHQNDKDGKFHSSQVGLSPCLATPQMAPDSISFTRYRYIADDVPRK